MCFFCSAGDDPACYNLQFHACTESSGSWQNIDIINATVTPSESSNQVDVDATEAARDIVQCSMTTCEQLAVLLLDELANQFCLEYSNEFENLYEINVIVQVYYSGKKTNRTFNQQQTLPALIRETLHL